MIKSIKIYQLLLVILLSSLLGGCLSTAKEVQPKTDLSGVMAQSYMITIGMDKKEVMDILGAKPPIIQRLNEDEMWIYENEQKNNETVENDFYTLMLKFKKGLVISIGAYSCKVPNLDR
jgi:outer membrane protein assembly factor BamE (lipoprotein component of BamABCDE complex)